MGFLFLLFTQSNVEILSKRIDVILPLKSEENIIIALGNKI